MIQRLFDEAAKLDSEAIRRRLLEARFCLIINYRDAFTSYRYDAAHKRLISGNGKYVLQWENTGRTNCGQCHVERILCYK